MRRTLHLVRTPSAVGDGGDLPPGVVERDWVVYLRTMDLAARGEPPIAPGRIDHDQLLDLIVRADRVITW